jgi:hypothetical protein
VRRGEESRSREVEEELARRPDGKLGSRGAARVARLLRPAQALTSHHALDPAMVEIQPEPSPEERAAILLALEQMFGATSREEPPARSAWAMAGRHESRPGRIGSQGASWGHESSRLADW